MKTFASLLRVSSLCAAAALMSLASNAAVAGPYSRLQVLLPGETAAPGTPSGKAGSPQSQTSGIPFDVRIRACDSDWSTVTSVTNLIDISSSDGTAVLPPDVTLFAGEATVSVTINASGTFLVSADDLSDTSIPIADSTPFQAFRLQGFEFDRINQKNQYAGVPMPITVRAVDPTGALVSGFDGEVRLRQITSYGEGRIEPSVVTLSNGVWSGDVANFRADETSISRGNVNILAELPADPSSNGLSDPFVVHPGAHARVQLVVPGQNPAPGSLSGVIGTPGSQSVGQNFLVTVFATDEYWNPLPSTDQVRITSSDAGATTPVTGALVDGYAEFTIAFGTTGSQTLTITDQTNGAIQGMTSPPIAVTASGTHHFEIDPITGPITAGTSAPVTIRAVDSGGNPSGDFAGDAILTANTGAGSVTPTLITFVGGVWSGDVTFRGAGGAVSLSCSDFSSPPHTGTSASFEVVPGPYAQLQILLPGESPRGGTDDGVEGVPSAQSAGTGFDVRVRAVDAWWNLVPGIDHAVVLGSSDPFVSGTDGLALVNGELVAPVTLFAAGTQHFMVTDADDPSIAESSSHPVAVSSGPYTNLVLVLPGETLAPGSEDGSDGEAVDQSINFSFTGQVYATDQWFNAVSEVTDVVRATSTDPLAELPGDTPLVNGVADLTFRLATGGYQQITVENVTQPTMPVSTSQVRAITSGFHLEADVTPTEVEAGEIFTLTVRVTNDAGAVIEEVNSTASLTVRHAETSEPGRGSLSTTQFQLIGGQRTLELTYSAAEPIVLVVQDDAGNDPGITEVITVSPGPPASIDMTASATWVRGNRTAAIVARVIDAHGNGVPVIPVSFVLEEGAGTLTQVDLETAEDGVAAAEYLTPRHPETAIIRAESGTLVARHEVETALVDPSASPGSITSYPNPFHPDELDATLAYKLADDASVTIEFYTLSGTLVRTESFDNGAPGGRAGLNEFRWDGLNGQGREVASGTYVVQLTATGSGETLHRMRHRVAVVR